MVLVSLCRRNLVDQAPINTGEQFSNNNTILPKLSSNSTIPLTFITSSKDSPKSKRSWRRQSHRKSFPSEPIELVPCKRRFPCPGNSNDDQWRNYFRVGNRLQTAIETEAAMRTDDVDRRRKRFTIPGNRIRPVT